MLLICLLNRGLRLSSSLADALALEGSLPWCAFAISATALAKHDPVDRIAGGLCSKDGVGDTGSLASRCLYGRDFRGVPGRRVAVE